MEAVGHIEAAETRPILVNTLRPVIRPLLAQKYRRALVARVKQGTKVNDALAITRGILKEMWVEWHWCQSNSYIHRDNRMLLLLRRSVHIRFVTE